MNNYIKVSLNSDFSVEVKGFGKDNKHKIVNIGKYKLYFNSYKNKYYDITRIYNELLEDEIKYIFEKIEKKPLSILIENLNIYTKLYIYLCTNISSDNDILYKNALNILINNYKKSIHFGFRSHFGYRLLCLKGIKREIISIINKNKDPKKIEIRKDILTLIVRNKHYKILEFIINKNYPIFPRLLYIACSQEDKKCVNLLYKKLTLDDDYLKCIDSTLNRNIRDLLIDYWKKNKGYIYSSLASTAKSQDVL